MRNLQFYTKAKAAAQVQRSSKTGWPNANAQKQENGLYIISAHKRFCGCGCCPYIRSDGYLV